MAVHTGRAKHAKRFMVPAAVLLLIVSSFLLVRWHIDRQEAESRARRIHIMDSENTACYGEYASLLEGLKFLGFKETPISRKGFEATMDLMVCIDPDKCPRFTDLLQSDKSTFQLTPADLMLINYGFSRDMETARTAAETYRSQVHIDKIAYDWKTTVITVMGTDYSTSEIVS